MAFDKNAILHGACNVALDGVQAGYTKGGVKVRDGRTFLDIEADQAAGIIAKKPIMDKMFVTFNLLEGSDANMIIALNGDAAGSGNVAFGEESPETVERLLTLTGPAPSGQTRTYTFYRAVKVEDTEHLAGGREAVGELPVVFEILKDPAHGYLFGYYVDAA
jgi:hypothetical protein